MPCRRPDELSSIQPLGIERQTDAVVPEDFRQIAAAAAKNVKVAGVRIAFELLLDLKRQAMHAPAHVGVARRDPYTASRGYRDHDRNAFKAAVIADEGASA